MKVTIKDRTGKKQKLNLPFTEKSMAGYRADKITLTRKDIKAMAKIAERDESRLADLVMQLEGRLSRPEPLSGFRHISEITEGLRQFHRGGTVTGRFPASGKPLEFVTLPRQSGKTEAQVRSALFGADLTGIERRMLASFRAAWPEAKTLWEQFKTAEPQTRKRMFGAAADRYQEKMDEEGAGPFFGAALEFEMREKPYG